MPDARFLCLALPLLPILCIPHLSLRGGELPVSATAASGEWRFWIRRDGGLSSTSANRPACCRMGAAGGEEGQVGADDRHTAWAREMARAARQAARPATYPSRTAAAKWKDNNINNSDSEYRSNR